MGQLIAGAARVRLDPPLGIGMAGYGRRVGRASGVHDDLAAQALVLGDGHHKAAIVSVDLLAIGLRIVDEICAIVAARSDIPADAILVCATHTHSGPLFNIHATPKADAKVADDRSLAWERALPEKIASAVIDANARLGPATLKAASARFTLGTNRRLRRPDGTVQLAANHVGVADAAANAAGVYRSDGSALAYLLNYPCHAVVLCEDNLRYSRDWPGFAIDEIERLGGSKYGGAGQRPIALFLQGATGNIDPHSRGSFEVAAEHGAALGRAAFDALERAPLAQCERTTARSIPLTLRLRDLDTALEIARNYVAQTELSLKNHRGGEGIQLKRLRDHCAQAKEALATVASLDEANRRDRRVNREHGEIATRLLALALGDVAIVGIGGEPFVELGLALKANPYFAHTLVAGYCNDLVGYLPTREAYRDGGYEVETSRVAEGSGELIVATLLSALREMSAAPAP
ncbi:MAG: neutral/alkaline non-lysosomal ceramidase N-terminal domain-containing protein [Candidatus Binataceae bacterium]